MIVGPSEAELAARYIESRNTADAFVREDAGLQRIGHERLIAPDLAAEENLNILEGGGNRVRGILGMLGNHMVGGDDPKVARAVVLVSERPQASMIQIDDITDGSEERRGQKAVHLIVADRMRQTNWQRPGSETKDAEAVVTVESILGILSPIGILGKLAIDDARFRTATRLYYSAMCETALGQKMDSYLSGREQPASREEIIYVAEKKTAIYTTVFPLQLGMVLGGGKKKDLLGIEGFARNAGIAYQLLNELKTVSDPDREGEGNPDDVRGNKQTLLLYHTIESVDKEDRQFIEDVLTGRISFSDRRFRDIKDLIITSGAVEKLFEEVEIFRGHALRALDRHSHRWPSDDIELLKFLFGMLIRKASGNLGK